MDEDRILNRIYDILESTPYNKALPNIYLLHGDLSDEEMNDVYNDPRVKAMVSLTKGEGYGKPLAEFATVGKPILVSGWSGHRDFLDEKNTCMVGGTLQKVHPSAVRPHVILPESSWFKPDDNQVIAGFREIFNNYDSWAKRAARQGNSLAVLKNVAAMGDVMDDLLAKAVPDFPEEVQLVLPKELIKDE